MNQSGAVISKCGKYRYLLWREWPGLGDKGTCLFICLNPSTADATTNDPSIRRMIGFTKKWGYGRLEVVNLFAYRATDPRELKNTTNPIGVKHNDRYISQAVLGADCIVAAWGSHSWTCGRDEIVLELLRDCEILCLGKTKRGHPKHPLYVKADTPLEIFR